VSSKLYLLDTSALIAYLEAEDGADRVNILLLNEDILIPWAALLEVYYITLQERENSLADQRYKLLKQLPATILWSIDESTLLTAAHFKAAHRVSFADAIVAGFAATHNAILVHKDPEFEVLKDKVQLEFLPYKKHKQ